MQKRILVAFITFMVAVIFTIVTSTTNAAVGESSGVSEKWEDRGDWKYQAALNREEGRVNASIRYNMETTTQALNVASIHRRMAEGIIAGGIKTLEATIVFNKPLTQIDFEQFVLRMKLSTISSYTMRYVNNQGQRVTINGGPDNDMLIPQDLLATVLTDLQQHDPGSLSGWIQVEATLDSSQYRRLLRDRDVYLIDVSKSVIRLAYKDEPNSDILPIDIVAPQLYWNLEDLHLVSK
jgi:hypothetical protein